MYCLELDWVCANCVPTLSENYEDPEYFACRGILTAKVVNVHMLNQKVLDIFPGQAHPPLNSVDTADENDGCQLQFNLEVLHSMTPSGMATRTNSQSWGTNNAFA